MFLLMFIDIFAFAQLHHTESTFLKGLIYKNWQPENFIDKLYGKSAN